MSTKSVALVVPALVAGMTFGAGFNLAGGGSLGNPEKWDSGSVPTGGDGVIANWGPTITLEECDSLTFSKLEFGNQWTGCCATFDIGTSKSVLVTSRMQFDANYGTTSSFLSGTWGISADANGEIRFGDIMPNCSWIFDGPNTLVRGSSLDNYIYFAQWSSSGTTVVFTNGAQIVGAIKMGPNTPDASGNLMKITGVGSQYLFPTDCAASQFVLGGQGGRNRILVDDGASFRIEKDVALQMGAGSDSDKTVSGCANELTVAGGASAYVKNRIEIGTLSHSNAVSVLAGGALDVSELRIGCSRAYMAKDPACPTGNGLLVSGEGSSAYSRGDVFVGYDQAVDSWIEVADGARLGLSQAHLILNNTANATGGFLKISNGGLVAVTNSSEEVGLYVGKTGAGARMAVDGGQYDGGTCNMIVGCDSGATGASLSVFGGGSVSVRKLTIGNNANDCRMVVSNGTVVTTGQDMEFGIGSGRGAELVVAGTNSHVETLRNMTAKNGTKLTFEVPADGYARTPVEFLSFIPSDATTIKVRFAEDFPGGTVKLMQSTRSHPDWDDIDYSKLTFDVEEGIKIYKDQFSISVRKPRNTGLVLILN